MIPQTGNISSGKIEFKREYIETGHKIKPIRTDIKVCTKTGGEIFDYKIKRYGINKSGYGTITVEGKNNNTGEITGRFRIYKNIMNGEISTFLDCSTYTGKEIKPNATVSYSGIKLTKDIDYTLKYINNVNVGTATIMATGKGFYRGVRMKTFTIKPRNINKTNIVLNNSKYTYTGKAIEPRAIVRDSSRVLNIHHDYEVNYSNNIYAEKPGYSNQAEIIISGIGNYTGIPKKSDLEVYAKNGARIYDFEITEYGKNIEESGQITVSGINNNIGTIIGNFKISKKTILNVAEEIHQYMDDVGYGYNTAYLAPTFEESKKYNSVVCSTYVGWVLKELNLLEDNLELNNCKQLEEALLYKMNWQKIPGDKTTLQPGDIIIYGYLPDASGEQHRNHTDIYVGDGKKLNAGHELGPNTKYGHYDSFCEKYITGDLEEGWDRYWVYRPLEYK